MGIKKQSFGFLPNRQEITQYTLTNQHGIAVSIINYGGIITSFFTPDRDGNSGDIVLGFDNIYGYTSDEYMAKMPYFGAIIGRYANRIAKGRFAIDGKKCRLTANNRGNHMHGGNTGFDKVLWEVKQIKKNGLPALKLGYLSKDGEEGYPGNLQVSVIYSLSENNELKIDYAAETDIATPVTLTNHSYFNLAAGKAKDILNHRLEINADQYLVMNDEFIPSGELRSVEGTPLDFKAPRTIDARIENMGKSGYAHTYALNKESEQMTWVATLYDPVSGREMKVFTTEPGLILYTGKFLDGTLTGKGGIAYTSCYGVALETQHFADSPNHPEFPSTLLKPGEIFTTSTIYKLDIR